MSDQNSLNYNLRGVEVKIEEFGQDPVTPSSTHYHYLLFIDVTFANTVKFPAITWSVSGDVLTGAIAEDPTRPFPATGGTVRTYLLTNYKLVADSLPLKTVQLKNSSNQIIATGDPSSRKPPIVKVNTKNLADWQGLAYGILTELRQAPAVPPLPVWPAAPYQNTVHTNGDYFGVVLAKVPPGYSNTLSCSLRASDNKILGQGNILATASGVAAVGVYDCTANTSIDASGKLDISKNQYMPPNIPLDFIIKLAPGTPEAGPIPIEWAEF